MFSWVGRFREPESAVVGFGKVPGTAEYVRAGPKTSAITSFEQWLVEGTEWAAHRRAGLWKSKFDSAGPHSFVYRLAPESGAILVGVVAPSHDAVGRRFPLVVCALLPSKAVVAAAGQTPKLFEPFLERASRVLENARKVRNASDLKKCLEGLEPPDLSGVERVSSAWVRWTETTDAKKELESAYANKPQESIERALHMILDATAPFKGQEAPPTSLSLRLPLSPDSNALCAFWVEFVRLAAGWRQAIPGWFADSSGNSVLVQLGYPAPVSLLADLWAVDPESDHVCDLTACAEMDTSCLVTPMPEALSAALEEPEATLKSVLEAVE